MTHHAYLMENIEEARRLEVKTDPAAVREQAAWCGVKPGQRVLDAGCGSGKVTSILWEMVQPGGSILGLDYSADRVAYAQERYGGKAGIAFGRQDFKCPVTDFGQFDVIWVRFVLEYFRAEGYAIVQNIATALKPGGILCLLDLDHNSLNHYGLSKNLENALCAIMRTLEREFNFDPYMGRKLYARLYDMGYEKIEMRLMAHHLLYGELKAADAFNWQKKAEIASEKVPALMQDYPGGRKAFLADFNAFFTDPRRFSYTPLIMCKGQKPAK